MSIRVNPPPQVRIPRQFQQDRELRTFFEQNREILFQLWSRTGGNLDLVAGQQLIIATSADYTVADYSTLVVVEADTTPVTIRLPAIASNTIGQTVSVLALDATNDITVLPNGATINGEASVIMNQDDMLLPFTSITTSYWSIT